MTRSYNAAAERARSARTISWRSHRDLARLVRRITRSNRADVRTIPTKSVAMWYEAARGVLFALDAERAHDVGIAAVAAVARRPALARAIRTVARVRDRAVAVAGIRFPNPIGLAAGMDKNAIAPLGWWALGFGFVELGTVTPLPQAGNPRPRLFRLPRSRALVNRLGFNNDGAAVVAGRLARQAACGERPSSPLGISIGKNATTPLEDAASDYATAARVLAPHADYLAINVSSPNTPGLRGLQSAEALARIVDATQQVAADRPLFVKLAPELDDDACAAVVTLAARAGVAGLIASNTRSTASDASLPQGGLSGEPLRAAARDRIAALRRAVPTRFALVGCGGIDDAASARAMLAAGADLVQLYTGLVYRGPLLAARLSRDVATR